MSQTLQVDNNGNFVRSADEHDLTIVTDQDALIAEIQFLLQIQIGELDELTDDDVGLDRIPLLGKDIDEDDALQAIEDCITDQIPEVTGVEDADIDLDYATRTATVSLTINAEDGSQIPLTTTVSTTA